MEFTSPFNTKKPEMKINITAKNPEHVTHLTAIGEITEFVLAGLSQEYRFQLPPQLTLKIYHPRKRERKKTLTFAQSEVCAGEFCIKFNPCMFNTTREHLLTKIAEETAHIAEELHVGRFGHSKLFYQIKEKAMEFAKEVR